VTSWPGFPQSDVQEATNGFTALDAVVASPSLDGIHLVEVDADGEVCGTYWAFKG